MTLNVDDLKVSSFSTDSEKLAYEPCCTGCDSGCGIIPTGGGCVSSKETEHDFCM